MERTQNGVEPDQLGLAELQRLTALTATYQSRSDPATVLRSGLVEEVAEYVWEASVQGTIDTAGLQGELGDVLWYVSEISRYHQVPGYHITGGRSFDSFQHQAKPLVRPVYDTAGQLRPLAQDQLGVLAVTALRVVDVLNPKHSDLWLPNGDRLPLGTALKDLLTAASFVANTHNLSLTDAAGQTITKLANRARKPHVVNGTAEAANVSSNRQRLKIDQFIGKLIVDAYKTQIFDAEAT